MLFDSDFDFISLISKNNTSVETLNSKDGFLKGNMFALEFVPYKEYKCQNLKACNEKEAYLFKIMELTFALNDLNLYLDLHPDDQKVYNEFKSYVSELESIENEYAKKYNPLELNQNVGDKDNWLGNDPWKGSETQYV